MGISVDEAVAAASVTVTGSKRRGPLHIAAAKGNVEICRFLINTYKVSVDATDSDGNCYCLCFVMPFVRLGAMYCFREVLGCWVLLRVEREWEMRCRACMSVWSSKRNIEL